MEFVSPEGLRIDGRRPQELRAVQCHFGALSSCDGSSLFQAGNTKVSGCVSALSIWTTHAGAQSTVSKMYILFACSRSSQQCTARAWRKSAARRSTTGHWSNASVHMRRSAQASMPHDCSVSSPMHWSCSSRLTSEPVEVSEVPRYHFVTSVPRAHSLESTRPSEVLGTARNRDGAGAGGTSGWPLWRTVEHRLCCSVPAAQPEVSKTKNTGRGAAGAARRRRGGRSRRNTELAALVRGALEQTILVELLPRAQVDICVQVLFADGGVPAACINAAMLAVADAGAGPWSGRHLRGLTCVHLHCIACTVCQHLHEVGLLKLGALTS